MTQGRRALLQAGAGLAGAGLFGVAPAFADAAGQIDQSAAAALRRLYATEPRARELGGRARAVLVFPRIIKAGLLVGGESGEGVLWVRGRVSAFYRLSAASFGLQAGAQSFSYALFFMTAPALSYLQRNNGWAIGSGPSVVVVNRGAAASVTSATLTHDVYAFPFGEHGLMAGLGLEGSKITRIHPS